MQSTSVCASSALLSVATSTLFVARRAFVQGGPPPPKLQDGIDPMKKLCSHRAEMDARYAAQQQSEREFYARTPHIPPPLPHNSYEKGQYGMRRRIKVQDRSDDISLDALNVAVEMGNHAMRKG
ncbi:hypothetical protein DQ04_00191150 [Trypanosoma grayi]|uniref:hypothetical protein n=1 Tax=Trypanosoma grayi TaxID=71804 RepID=UPI0004F48215|nr:hypothetical protein DQ04_00191150 [Trypanosoma grayi]KEG15091.1 hypothetical protein DQ04_00191150 [Trypanosoma grayi]